MTQPRTPAERYLAERLKNPEYLSAYREARDRISRIDAVMQALDARREELALSKAELARRAGVKPEAVRRLFASERQNPTLATIVALADALDVDFVPVPRSRAGRPVRQGRAAARGRSGSAGTPQPTP
jgi:DNA-binding phage protein